jgi:hypothetical protein
MTVIGHGYDDNAGAPTYRNRIINGSFDIWQRNNTFSFTGVSGAYTADRWAFYMDGTSGAVTVSRQAFSPGTAPVTGYEGTYFARINRTAAGTGTTYSNFQQPIEDVRTFAGQTITVSFWAKADTARSLGISLTQDFGTGGSTSVSLSTNTVSITTSWQRFSYTYIVPSIAGKTISATDSKLYMFFQCGNAVSTFDIWGVQIEKGSVATPFEVEPYEITLRKCQRYYIMIANANTMPICNASAYSTSQVYGVYTLPVTMRAAPTADFVTGSNYFAFYTNPATPVGFTTLVLSVTTTLLAEMAGNGAFTGGSSGWIRTNNAAARVALTAEL